MSRDDIIRMARGAGFETANEWERHPNGFFVVISRFAALVAAAERDKYEAKFKQLEAIMQAREQQPNKPCCLAEREACAKKVEVFDKTFQTGGGIAGAIRARSTP